MVSSPISRLRYLDGRGTAIEVPLEWTRAFVEIHCEPEQLELVKLRRNGVALEISRKLLADRYRVVAEWPLSGAGHYELELTIETGEDPERHRCTVQPRKLDATAVELMLVDLQRRLPASIAIALQRGGALAGLELVAPDETTLAEELDRLRRAIDGTRSRAGLARVLELLAQRPYQALRGSDVWTDRDRARRIDVTRLAQAFGQPGNLDEHRLPIRVPERRVEHSVDLYENRLLKAFHDQVNDRVRQLARAPRTRRSERLSREAQELTSRLASARRAARFLDRVSDLVEPPSRITMVLMRRSEYREALEGFLEFRRRVLVRLHEPALQAPLENLPFLYQSWGALTVIRVLLESAADHGFRVREERLIHRRDGELWIEILRNGQPAVVLAHPQRNSLVRVIPQRRYSPGAAGLHSVSFTQIPDVAIEVTDESGTRVYIFDPKYKLQSEATEDHAAQARPKKTDVDAMHSYRDSIRGEDERHVVRYAAILYPGTSAFYAEGLEAIRAHPNDSRTLESHVRDVLSQALAPKAPRAPRTSSPGTRRSPQTPPRARSLTA